LRLTVSQSVRLGVESHLGLMTRYFRYCLTVTVLFLWGALSDEKTGLSFIYSCWPFLAHCFSGPSPKGLASIFYCLRFETSLFVASYDLRGHGGGIRPRLHTGLTTILLLLRLYICLAYRLEDTESNSSAIRYHEKTSPLCRKRLSTLLWEQCLSGRCSTTDCFNWSPRIRVSTSRYPCNGFTCHNIITAYLWRNSKFQHSACDCLVW
jgi:hypothetical protein